MHLYHTDLRLYRKNGERFFEVDDSADEVKAQTQTVSMVAIFFDNNLKVFDSTNNMLDFLADG